MAKAERLTIRLDPDLKQALVNRSEQTGQSISHLVAQAVKAYLESSNQDATDLHATLTDLIVRVEHLEEQMQYPDRSPAYSEAPPTAHSTTRPMGEDDLTWMPRRPADLPEPDYSLLTPSASSKRSETDMGSADPNLWDPLRASFEDWLFRIWSQLATDQFTNDPQDRLGLGHNWGCPIPIDQVHELGFYDMRLQRFQDRLIAAEIPGLGLMVDTNTVILEDDLLTSGCDPKLLTFFNVMESNVDLTFNLN